MGVGVSCGLAPFPATRCSDSHAPNRTIVRSFRLPCFCGYPVSMNRGDTRSTNSQTRPSLTGALGVLRHWIAVRPLCQASQEATQQLFSSELRGA